MKTLRDVSIGQTVKVVKLHGEGPIKRRIMDMGITKGTEVYIRTDETAAKFHSDCLCGATAHKTVQYYIAGVGRCFDNTFK